jgi:tRNA-guanine family transglycosylase
MEIDMSNLHYIPATTDKAEQLNIHEGEKLNWWEKDSLFFYPYVLFSSFYGRTHMNLRKEFRIDDEVEVVLDSGGFQQLSQGITLDPVQILKWQEMNGDVGMILDFPPVSISTDQHGLTTPVSYEEFQRRAQLTLKNAKLAKEHRTVPDFQLLNVLQGGSWEKLNYWYDTVNQVALDGWAIAPKPPSSPEAIIRDCLFLKHKGYTGRIHILGVSGITTSPFIAYISKYFDKVTFDTASPILDANTRYGYYLPILDGKKLIYFGSNPDRKFPHTTVKELPCDCPVCNFVNATGLEILNEYKKGTQLLTMHDVYIVLRYTKMMKSLVDDEEAFKLLIRSKTTTREGYEYLQKILKVGYEKMFTSTRTIKDFVAKERDKFD